MEHLTLDCYRKVIKPIIYFILTCFFQLAIYSTLLAQPQGFAEQILSDNFTQAVGLTFDATGRMFVWEKGGKVWILENGVRINSPLIDISEEVGDWRDFGLIGFTLDPNFLNNGHIYLLYVVDRHHLLTFGTSDYNHGTNEYFNATIGRITRYTATASSNYTSVDYSSRQVLLGATVNDGPAILHESHGVGSLVFGTDGTLLASIGDGASYTSRDEGSASETYYQQALSDGIITIDQNVGAYRSQMLDSYNGKILRIDPGTGEGVPGNPYFNANDPNSVRSKLWAVGVRNPFRMAFHPGTGSHVVSDGNPGSLFIGDVGWFRREELSVIDQGGRNLGWPKYEGMTDLPGYNDPTYEPSSHELPKIDWRTGNARAYINGTIYDVGSSQMPGNNFTGNASVGGVWYDGNSFPSEYHHTYFHGDFGGDWIRNFGFDTNNNPTFVKEFKAGANGIVAMAVGPIDGALYYIDGGSGRNNSRNEVHKIFYSPSNLPPIAELGFDKLTGASPLTIQFSGDQSTDPDGDNLTYLWSFGDGTTSTEANPVHTFDVNGGQATSFIVTLTVNDEAGLSDDETVTVSVNNSPPQIISTSVKDVETFSINSSTSLSLSAVVEDAEHNESELTYTWQTSLFHNDHDHPEPPDNRKVTNTVLSPVGCDGAIYWYRVYLTVTDAAGSSTSTFQDIYPDCNGQSQTITFGPVADKTVNDGPFDVQVSASSNLPVAVVVVQGPATISGTTVTLSGEPGTVVLRALQGGDGTYQPAKAEEQSFTVFQGNSQRAQSISFDPLPDRDANELPFDIAATASSGLPVTFSVVSGPATISSSTVTLNGTGGTVTIAANQAGNAEYLPAPEVTQSFQVSEDVVLGETVILTPVEDTYTNNASQHTGDNYGTANKIFARNRSSWGYKGYLKFDLSGLTGSVLNATLRMYGSNPNNSNSVTTGIKGIVDNWTETGLTYNNAPHPNTAVLGSVNINNAETYYEIPITSYAQGEAEGDGTLSLVIESLNADDERVLLRSRESSNSPELVLEIDEGGTLTNQPPTAEFTFNPSTGEAPITVNFDANASQDSDGTITSFSWDFGDGANGTGLTPNHTFNSPGTYTVSLTVTDDDGATDVIAKTVEVHGATPGGGETATINSEADTYTNNASAHQTENYGDKGKMIIRNRSSWGYEGFIRFDVSNYSGITKATLRLYGSSQDGNSQVPIGIYGTEDNWGENELNYQNAPSASAGQLASFGVDGTNTYASVDLTTYVQEQRGSDGKVSLLIRSESSGDEKVELYTKENSSNRPELILEYDTSTPSNQAPTAEFSFDPTTGEAPLTVNFNAGASHDPDGTITSYSWDFGDGGTGNGQISSNTFNSPGTYDITLTVIDDDEATGEITKSITIQEANPTNQPPVAEFTFTPSTGEAPLTVDFDASVSQDPDGTITSYSWDFGDGGTGNGQISSNTFNSPGTYDITLTVIDDDEATGEITKSITIQEANPTNQPPVAEFTFTPSTGEAPLTVDFDASVSHDPDGTITSYSWDFGDGGTGSGETISYTFNTPGTYSLSMVVTDNDGATDVTYNTIVVQGSNPGGETTTIGSEADTYTNNASAHQKKNYGDKGKMIIRNRNSWGYEGFIRFDVSNYSGITKATLRLYGSSQDGNSQAPIGIYGTEDNWGENELNYQNAPSASTGQLASFDVDGTNTYASVDLTTYVQEQRGGDGKVSLLIRSESSGDEKVEIYTKESSSNRPELILEYDTSTPSNQAPTAEFSFDPTTGEAPLAVNFDAGASQDPDGTITSYNWNFGEGGTGSGQTSSNTFNSPGTYNVTLTVTDDDGATGDITKSITIQEANPGTEVTVTINSEADSYTNNASEHLSTNYSTKGKMLIRNRASWGYSAYVRFDISGLSNVTNATLRMYGASQDGSSDISLGITGAEDNWVESEINYNNAPPLVGNQLASFDIDGNETYREITLTDYVDAQSASDGKVSLILTSLNSGEETGELYTKERGSNPPELVVTYLQPSVRKARNSVSEIDEINIFPNPFTSDFTLFLGRNPLHSVNVKVVNGIGQEIFSQLIQPTTESLHIGREWAKGLYWIYISTGKEAVYSQMIMKD